MSDIDDFNAMANSEWEDRFIAFPDFTQGAVVLDGANHLACKCYSLKDADVVARALNRFFTEMWRYEPREDEDLDAKFGRGSE